VTDDETMLLIKSKSPECVFTYAQLVLWLVEAEGKNRETIRQRVYRVIKRLPVELLGGKYYRLLITPQGDLPKARPMPEKEPGNFGSVAKEVLEYLNKKAGTRYKGKPADLLKIKARMAAPENHTLQDFKTVIDKKVDEWKGTTMEKYLRPETLFSPKFESYLNQSGPSKQQTKVEQMAGYDFTKYIKGE
jgi:uncharacterized phage protein (TIGR02220 family)